VSIVKDPLIIVSDDFKLGSRSERFLIKVSETSNEVAAVSVSAILIYSLRGSVTLSALRLAERHSLPIVLLEYSSERVIPLVRSRKKGPIEELMGRFESWKREKIKRAILNSYKEGMQSLSRLYDLNGLKEDPERVVMTNLGEGAVKAIRQLRLLLWGELCARMLALGLDPHIGLWMIEELGFVKELSLVFQPLVVYAPVIGKGFRCEEVSSEERRKLALEYDKIMREEYYNPKLSRKVRIRDQLVHECISLIQALRGSPLGYSPFRW